MAKSGVEDIVSVRDDGDAADAKAEAFFALPSRLVPSVPDFWSVEGSGVILGRGTQVVGERRGGGGKGGR